MRDFWPISVRRRVARRGEDLVRRFELTAELGECLGLFVEQREEDMENGTVRTDTLQADRGVGCHLDHERGADGRSSRQGRLGVPALAGSQRLVVTVSTALVTKPPSRDRTPHERDPYVAWRDAADGILFTPSDPDDGARAADRSAAGPVTIARRRRRNDRLWRSRIHQRLRATIERTRAGPYDGSAR